MKKFHSILLIPLMLVSVCVGQKVLVHQKSDSESEGLKGGVQSVKYERAPVTKNGDQWTEGARAIKSTETYDLRGNLTQTESYIGAALHTKNTYFDLDGERAFKFESFGRGGGGPGNPGKPDPRFSFKYQYKYDAQGNRKEVKRINNYGRLTALTINKYDSRGNLIESIETEYLYNTKPPEHVEKTSYSYNDKGETTHVTGPMYSIDYSDYKYDETGNWISRKEKMDYTYDGKTTTTLRLEYRTITYHVVP